MIRSGLQVTIEILDRRNDVSGLEVQFSAMLNDLRLLGMQADHLGQIGDRQVKASNVNGQFPEFRSDIPNLELLSEMSGLQRGGSRDWFRTFTDQGFQLK